MLSLFGLWITKNLYHKITHWKQQQNLSLLLLKMIMFTVWKTNTPVLDSHKKQDFQGCNTFTGIIFRLIFLHFFCNIQTCDYGHNASIHIHKTRHLEWVCWSFPTLSLTPRLCRQLFTMHNTLFIYVRMPNSSTREIVH